MIVMMIIAVLASISLPVYQDYVAKSLATAGLADIRPGKTGVEEAYANGTESLVDAAYVGLGNTFRCTGVSAMAAETNALRSVLSGT